MSVLWSGSQSQVSSGRDGVQTRRTARACGVGDEAAGQQWGHFSSETPVGVSTGEARAPRLEWPRRRGAAEHVAGTGRSRETLALCPQGCPQDAARPARASRHLAPRCVRCDVRPPAQPLRGPTSPWGRSDSKRGGAQGGSRGRHTAPGRVRPHGRRAGGAQRGPRAGDELALAGRQLCPGQPRAERLADPGPRRQLRPHAGPWTARTGCPGRGGVAQRGTGTFLGREGTFLTCWSHSSGTAKHSQSALRSPPCL